MHDEWKQTLEVLQKPFAREDLKPSEDPDSDGGMEAEIPAVFARLNEAVGLLGWSIGFTYQGEVYVCTLGLLGGSKAYVGPDIPAAILNAAELWGMPVYASAVPQEIAAEKKAAPPPQPDPLSIEPQTSVVPASKAKVWTEDRAARAKKIKDACKITDNAQFGPFLMGWSEGKINGLHQLTAETAEGFLSFMEKNYVHGS